MCGILGKVPAGSKKQFDNALARLSHRGPDDFGTWSDGREIELGHTRLAILDISKGGRQPMVDRTGRYVIVFNGEIYNFLEIRRSLEKLGVVVCGESDTEVLLAAYSVWRESCVSRFNGMWALAIWDCRERALFLSRDRFGKKPLFYAHLQNRELVFASEMKAIFPYLDRLQPSEDIESKMLFLFDYEHTSDCVVKGISRLPAGHSAIFQDGRMRVFRWWNTLDHLVQVPVRYEEQVEIWREIFLDSVKLRMRSDVKIGTALSGGLDSSSTFAAMAHLNSNRVLQERASPDWQNSFCAHFPGSSLDEVHWAQRVASHVGASLTAVRIDPLNFDMSIEESLYQCEDPYLTLPLPMLATYRAIAKAGIRVTLDGHGADELFCGYGHLDSLYDTTGPREWASLQATMDSTKTGLYEPNNHYLLPRWLKHRLWQKLRVGSRLPRRLGSAALGRITLNQACYRLHFEDQAHPAFKAMDPLSKKLYELVHITILPTLLRNYDRYSMASGVEIRMPFLDHRLVTFTFSLPWASKVGCGYTKRILRDAMKGLLPEEVRLRRDKIGFNSPLHEWLRGPLRCEVDRFVGTLGESDARALRWRQFQQIHQPNFEDGERMWRQIMPELWKRSLQLHS